MATSFLPYNHPLFQVAGKNSGDTGMYGRFRNPWNDFSSRLMPDDIKEALALAEFLWYANGTFSKACSMVGRYFITEIEFDLKDDEKIEDYKALLNDQMGINSILGLLGDDFMCYSNCFYSIVDPFDRLLKCPETGTLVNIEEAEKNEWYIWEDYKFKKTDKGIEHCNGSKADFELQDTASQDVNRLLIKRWSPHEIEVKQEEWSQEKVFYWNIPGEVKNKIKQGDVLTLKNIPKEVIKAVEVDGKFKFAKNKIFHFADETVAGVHTGGWGIPFVIRLFRMMYRAQLLDRYDEAINLDYITGLRVISPKTAGTGSNVDPIKMMGMDSFKANVTSMIQKHRMDPTTWHTSSLPLEYQHMGAEGAQLTPVDLKDRADANILNAIGVPQELYRMTLTTQAAPLALRLFEQTWPQMSALYNKFLNWLSDSLATRYRYSQAKLKMTKPTISDDLTRREILLQLMGGQQVSPQTALKGLGIGDFRSEVRKVLEAERIRMEEERKMQEEMDQEQKFQDIKAQMSPQGPPGGAAPAGAPPGAGIPPTTASGGMVNPDSLKDPEALAGEADRIANQLLTMDPTARRAQLTSLTKSYETLSALVKEKLRKLEQGAASAGVQAARQGQMAPPPPQG